MIFTDEFIEQIKTADAEYQLFQELLSVHKENYYKCMTSFVSMIGDQMVHNKQCNLDGWLEIREEPDNMLHPYTFRFAPVTKDGGKSGRSRVIKGYDDFPTVKQRMGLIATVIADCENKEG